MPPGWADAHPWQWWPLGMALHALVGAPGSGQLIDAPKPESTEKFSLDEEMGTMSTDTTSPTDEEPFFFTGG